VHLISYFIGGTPLKRIIQVLVSQQKMHGSQTDGEEIELELDNPGSSGKWLIERIYVRRSLT